MELIRGLHNLRERHRGCVLSIGNFDGFHRGHQALIARLREQARRHAVPATVQVFEPTPRELFAPAQAPGRVATLRDKLGQLEAAGVERVLIVRFDRKFAAIPAARYVEEVLVGKLGLRAIVVGEDFRFGRGRSGDLAFLRTATRHFSVEAMRTVDIEGERASSTAVRAALAQGRLAHAAALLGRNYAIAGHVAHGEKLGRSLGFPTANIPLRRRPALTGIFAVRVHGLPGAPRAGVASVGVRPTVTPDGKPVAEVFLLDFDGDLYGREIEVEFIDFIRADRKFDSSEALITQMQADCERVRDILAAET